jgi:hypothetical protein
MTTTSGRFRSGSYRPALAVNRLSNRPTNRPSHAPSDQYAPPGQMGVDPLDEHRVDSDNGDIPNREVVVGQVVDNLLGTLVGVVGTDRCR